MLALEHRPARSTGRGALLSGGPVDDLVQWLGEQLDEDERIAVPGESWTAFDESTQGTRRVDVDHSIERVVACTRSWRGKHIAAWDPARVLRETDAKRQILSWYERRAQIDSRGEDESDYENVTGSTLETVVRLLALPYADRPGYRDDWRP